MMAPERFSDEDSTDEFTPISPARCQELLESQSIGRVAWQAADGPQILPVTYACHDGTIIFRTSPYGVLSELVRPTDVALEIDELDQEEPPRMERGGTGPRAGGRRARPARTHVDGRRCRSLGLRGQERVHPDHSPPDNRADASSTACLRTDASKISNNSLRATGCARFRWRGGTLVPILWDLTPLSQAPG